MENDLPESEQCGITEFTRFVLPFQWRAVPVSGPESGEGFRRIEAGGKDWLTLPPKPQPWEHSYFTHEVRGTVYERAGWFILRKAGSEITLGKFRIRPAGLVLFESNRVPGFESAAARLTKQGLLILQAEPADVSRPPSLVEWLEFNEKFRYVLSPWPEKEKQLKEWFDELGGLRPIPAGSNGTAGGELTLGRWLAALLEPVELGENEWIRLGEPTDMRTVPRDHFPYAESRAYVWSALIQDKAAQELLCETARIADNKLPEKCGAWVKALNVDFYWAVRSGGEALLSASPFERQWAEKRTYWRWAFLNTLYGFTPHSGVMLKAPGDEWLIKYFKESYFTMAMLALAIRQRMAALRSRVQLTRDTVEVSDGPQREMTDVLGEMLEFTNLYWFPHVSNQQQGQEMYPLLRDSMELETCYRDLRRDIEATEGWLRARQAEEHAKIQTRFAWIAGVGLVLSISATILSITDLSKGSWKEATITLAGGMALLLWALWFRVRTSGARLRAWIQNKCQDICGSCDCRKG